ncbi:MAG: hypothetical protein COY81_00385 [Candidatus Pacebacteria bacterium CG_4_10_14_0_8_um_filter_43_12]|nr:MAG: hypothetical protein COU66_03640 [Candidatus Pacebacteria bacterium CG10_big_fil_rev_8_21_14_0_10_44_11]PIY79934.1 MAG: hypothetical protein COY81_00385 [Candidatus Pacebacteria bacterium CG_4_10_14_0_8_um_filter_43_12]
MKTRLTITLSPDLLDSVDLLVDKKTIRNRSHAIEHLIRQSLGVNVTTAMILAGGTHRGKNNPLIKKIEGVDLFFHQIEHLKQFGIKRVIVCLNKLDRPLAKRFGSGSEHGLQILYSYEAKPLGTAGALKNASHLISDQKTVLIVHGDVLTSLSIDDLIKFHLTEDTEVTMAVKPNLGKKELGQVYLQGSRVMTFAKIGVESEISITNTGVYVLNLSVLKTILPNTVSFLESDVFPQLAQANKLRAFIYQGIWYDISTQDQYQKAQKWVSSHH